MADKAPTQPKRMVAIPLPTDTYDIARQEADEAGLMVGTKIRMDLIAYYNGVARRRARSSTKNIQDKTGKGFSR